MSGVEPGSSVNRLELSAAVHGLRYIAGKDHTDRPVVVYTDSDVVIRVLECVRAGAEMPNTPFYNLVHDLYVEARQLTGSRVLRVARRAAGDRHHTLCDRVARQALREHCSGTTWSPAYPSEARRRQENPTAHGAQGFVPSRRPA